MNNAVFENEKQEVQIETVGKFMDRIDSDVKYTKNRINQLGNTKMKRKYFRQPKIY